MRVNIFKNKNWIDLIYGDEMKVSAEKKPNSFFKNRQPNWLMNSES